jgi:hypothetical protein
MPIQRIGEVVEKVQSVSAGGYFNAGSVSILIFMLVLSRQVLGSMFGIAVAF